MSELKFSVGAAVEVSLDDEDSHEIWYPATVLRETRSGSFMVRCKRAHECGPITVMVYVDRLHIRPSPPACVTTTFQLLEKVDAFCNFGWSSGVVTKVLSEGRYIVYFKSTKKEKELRHTDLRIPMLQAHGKWVHYSQGAVIGYQDAAMMSNSPESKDINLADHKNGSLPPENFGVAKGSKEIKTGQQERGRPAGKESDRSVSNIKIKLATKNEPQRGRTSKELSTESTHTKYINLGDNEKIGLLPENSSVVKGSKEGKSGQQERIRPIGKESDARSVSSMRIKGPTKNGPPHCRTSKELNMNSAPGKLQLLQECETQIIPIEQIDQPETLEAPISGVKAKACMEQFENGNEAHVNSASPGRKLEIPEEKFTLHKNKKTSVARKQGRGPGRPPGSLTKNRRISGAGVAAKNISVTESDQSYIQKPIVISLPCYNSLWNKPQAQSTTKLPVRVAGVEEEKKQLSNNVSDGGIVKTVNRDNPEVKGSNKDDSTPRRKRGRPFGSYSAGKKRKLSETSGVNETAGVSKTVGVNEAAGVDKTAEVDKAAEVNETAEALFILSSTRRRSTRERREVYRSAIDTLKPREKKLKSAIEILSSTQETEANLEEIAEGVITYTITENVEPVPSGVSGNISDEDKPLSTWIGEVHSLPNCTKLTQGGNASQSGKLDTEIDQMLNVKSNEETTSGTNVDLAESASQDEGTAKQREKAMDLVVKSCLPFCKTSPIWKVIESMEVFQQIPQNPHFQALNETKEHCREGLAICSMVTFSRLVEDITKFQFDDPRNILEDSMETLADLERQGFNVEAIRSRLDALVSIKRGHEPTYSLAKEIAEEEKERASIDQEIDMIDKKIAELKEKRALIVVEREKNDAKIGGLQLRYDPMKKALDAARSEFERVATAPW